MAKNGTVAGGARAGAGRKRKSIALKIADGDKEAGFVPKVFPEDGETQSTVEYLKAEQKEGGMLLTETIRQRTVQWLKARGCDGCVSPQLIDQYAVSVARWISVENLISDNGYLTTHGTGGLAPSPYIAIARDYMKQVTQIWCQIYQVVRENYTGEISGSPQDDFMEQMLLGGTP